MSRIALLVAAAVVACSGGTTSSPGPTGPTPPTTPDAAPAPVPLTRADCEAMVMHVLDLTIAEQGSAATGDRDKARAGLEQFVLECEGGGSPLRTELHRCVIDATTIAQVQACQPPKGAGSDNAK